MGAKELGARLRDVRQLRGRSLKAVAEPSRISPTYLQKLETGDVQEPSPNVLHRLATQLRIPYPELMELAGYVVPRQHRKAGESPGVNVLAQALSSEGLTEDELEELARYLRWYREGQQRRAGET